jgi:hypothetical protein
MENEIIEPNILERFGKKVYSRPFGSKPTDRVLIRILENDPDVFSLMDK